MIGEESLAYKTIAGLVVVSAVIAHQNPRADIVIAKDVAQCTTYTKDQASCGAAFASLRAQLTTLEPRYEQLTDCKADFANACVQRQNYFAPQPHGFAFVQTDSKLVQPVYKMAGGQLFTAERFVEEGTRGIPLDLMQKKTPMHFKAGDSLSKRNRGLNPGAAAVFVAV